MNETMEAIREIELDRLDDLMAELDNYMVSARHRDNHPENWASVGDLQNLREALEDVVGMINEKG